MERAVSRWFRIADLSFRSYKPSAYPKIATFAASYPLDTPSLRNEQEAP
jgi:hypothetical protein